jgi:ABC-type lipoprotein export system ATPase subunit
VPPDDLAARCRDIVQIYPSEGGDVAALRGIDAEFASGSITAVVGPSGAGKSTFLRAMACLERPAAGEVWIAGQRTAHLATRRRRALVARALGYVYQRPSDNLLDYLSVAEHVELAWRLRGAPLDRDRFEQFLAATTLSPLRRRRPGHLSAGEQQRLAFAMAVTGDPALVIADEPTSELDETGASTLVDLVVTLAENGHTFVIASHDPAVLAVADQVLAIKEGVLAAHAGATGDLLAVVDRAGRVQLPDEALDVLDDHRARVAVVDSEVHLRRP